VSNSGAIGATVAVARWMIVSLVKGAMRVVRTTSKLLPKSARDWMSLLPTRGSSAGAPPRSHLAIEPLAKALISEAHSPDEFFWLSDRKFSVRSHALSAVAATSLNCRTELWCAIQS
jgi:hypothetical protein